MVTKTAKSATAAGKGASHGKAGGNDQTGEQASRALKEGIVQRFSALNTIESDLAGLVRKSVSDTLRTGGAAASDLTNVIHHVVMGAIEASEEVGVSLTTSVKSVAKGVVMGVHDVGGDVVTASFETVRSLIKHSATLGADVGWVARHAVDGVIEATVESGGNIAQVGKKAIQGAIEEAENLSTMAVKSVKNVLIGIAGSLGETIGAALPHPGARAGEKLHHAAKSTQRH
jgi:hypothetical protein